MASFRSGIKIISDVSQRQGRTLLQRSTNTEEPAIIRFRSASSRSVSPQPQCSVTKDLPKHWTDAVTSETSWYSPFIKRQEKPVFRTLPMQSTVSSPTNSNKFLVPNKGPQQPNRYFTMEHCIKSPPPPFVGPPPDKRDCHKKTKFCFKETFVPKVADVKEEEGSRVACGRKTEFGKFCDNKSQVKPFCPCPKPVHKPPYKCPGPRKPRAKKQKPEVKPLTYKVCPKPPNRSKGPMCVALKPPKVKKPPPPRTPRRCLCPISDAHLNEANQAPPLYKMNPEIPFPVCHKKKHVERKPFQWPLTNLVCSGVPGGSCANQCEKPAKSADCKTIQGEPCVDDHPCPYRIPPPPPPPPDHCGPSRPAFPAGPHDDHHESASMTKSSHQRVPSSSATPRNVQSLTSTTNTGSFSTSSAAPRSAMSTGSLLKATTTSTAGSVSRKASSKPSTTSLNASNKLDCSAMPWNNKHKNSKTEKCKPLYRWPDCRVPSRTDCGQRKANRKKCYKLNPPTASFSECYRRVCKAKKCSPCPCVRVTPLSECDTKEKIRHLQPRERIFKERREFNFPPPTVELFVDPTIAACCEATKAGIPAPAPISCVTPFKKPASVPCTTKPVQKKGGCDCTIANFFKSLVSFLKGDSKCPTPPDEVKKAATAMKDSEPCPVQDVCKPKPKPSDSKPGDPSSQKDPKSPEAAETKGKKKKAPPRCSDVRLVGCGPRVREECIVIPNRHPCTKRLAPRPSFSECVRNDFPPIKCTECRIALKRAKWLIDMRQKGIKVTPKNLRMDCSLCLWPKSRDCNTVTIKTKCLKVGHKCQLASCSRVGLEIEKKPENDVPPPPLKECERPTSKCKLPKPVPQVCEKPPAEPKKVCEKGHDKSSGVPCNPNDELPANNPTCDIKDSPCGAAPSPYKLH